MRIGCDEDEKELDGCLAVEDNLFDATALLILDPRAEPEFDKLDDSLDLVYRREFDCDADDDTAEPAVFTPVSREFPVLELAISDGLNEDVKIVIPELNDSELVFMSGFVDEEDNESDCKRF